ncbi:unnamed protein product [Clavelina lepadiformis]|uniref:FAD dependent oxidoreductase domain-containing protein n=1 Tax=Clavelina lepadiformis TaxID=159417 RepID=A0ABP0GV84_CLALP
MYDVIVVGAGVEGLGTARYLAKSNANVLLFDQFTVPHSQGSSHGKSRGIRYTYSQPYYVEMMPEAFELWKELEKECADQLYLKTGIVCLQPYNMCKEVSDTLRSKKIPHQFLSSSEIEQRFPGLKAEKLSAIFEEHGGILKADNCISALLESFKRFGGIFTQGKVLSIQSVNGDLVKVKTNNGVFFAKSVVLACGPWINDVLKPLGLQIPVMPTKAAIVYWKVKTQDVYSASKFPVTSVTGSKHCFYSTPEMEYKDLVKVAYYGGIALTSPDDASKPLTPGQRAVEKEIMDNMKTFVSRHYPDLFPEPHSIVTCFFSMTPDEDFILDKHPKYSNIIIGAGFSGHGFKMAPVIGQILGDLALKKKSKYSLEPFSLSRFPDFNLFESKL